MEIAIRLSSTVVYLILYKMSFVKEGVLISPEIFTFAQLLCETANASPWDGSQIYSCVIYADCFCKAYS